MKHLVIKNTDIDLKIKHCFSCPLEHEEYGFCQLNNKQFEFIKDCDFSKHCPLPDYNENKE